MPSKDDLSGELLVDGTEIVAVALRSAVAKLDAIARELSVAEKRLWQPHWSTNDPLPERLRRVGVTDATADLVVCLVRGWEAFSRGEPFPAETNALLDLHEQCAASADGQLAAIVNNRAAHEF